MINNDEKGQILLIFIFLKYSFYLELFYSHRKNYFSIINTIVVSCLTIIKPLDSTSKKLGVIAKLPAFRFICQLLKIHSHIEAPLCS